MSKIATQRWLKLACVILLLGISVGCDSKTPDQHISTAHENVAAGEYRLAIIELKNAVQKDPQSSRARAMLGQLHLMVGDFPSALTELNRAIDLGDDSTQTHLDLLRAKNALGRVHEVIGELEQESSISAEYAVVLGTAYLRSGDIGRAKPLFERGLHTKDGLLGLAEISMGENDPVAAKKFAQQLVEKFPDDRHGWLVLGDLELRLQAPEDAERAFVSAQKLLGGKLPGLTGQIRALLMRDDIEGAAIYTRELTDEAPAFAPGQYLLGLVQFRQRDFEGAEEALRKVQQSNSDHLPSLFLMGAVHAEQGRQNQASDSLQRYLARAPESWSARKLLASIYQSQGRFDDAVAVLSTSDSAGADYQTFAMLGAVYMKQGNSSLATQAYEQAVALAPGDAAVRNQLALQLLVVGDDDAAMTQIESAMQTDQQQFQSDYLIAMMHLKKSDFAKAHEAADSVIS